MGRYLCVTVAPFNTAYPTSEAGGAANFTKRKKIVKYRLVLQNFHFVPSGFETFGFRGSNATKLLGQVASKQFSVTGER